MSTLRVNTIQDTAGSGSPTINGLARAWVNFNGTGTVAIRAASNVSSIIDNGNGNYTVNFTTAMPDVSYAMAFSGGTPNNLDGIVMLRDIAVGSVRVSCVTNNAATTAQDLLYITATVFR